MIANNDTITACATPPGRGGVGVVRISGPLTAMIARTILGRLPKPRYATYADFIGAKQEIIDRGIALYFIAPHSFTGEDVLELHGHGGPVVIDRLLARIIGLGARMAKPGEFSQRAFLNGKIDLTQAEAIADLISASSIVAAENAARSLSGEFSQYIYSLVNALIALRVQIEAAIDFVEDEIDFIKITAIAKNLTQILQEVQRVKNAAKQGVLWRDGITIVIAGKPNVGKSSLLNRFTGEATAIVTDIPGTTRDVLRSYVQIDGIPLHVLDTAGLHVSTNVVEQEGIKRALQEISRADHVLLVVDASAEKSREAKMLGEELLAQLSEHKKFTIIYNKIDLSGEKVRVETTLDGINSIYLSAKTGMGLDLLKEHLKRSVGFVAAESGVSARRRHLEALNQAEQQLLRAQDSLTNGTYELLAEDLRQVQKSLDEITGKFTTDDLLQRIFSEFCVGK